MSNDTRQTASDRACSSAVGLTLDEILGPVEEMSEVEISSTIAAAGIDLAAARRRLYEQVIEKRARLWASNQSVSSDITTLLEQFRPHDRPSCHMNPLLVPPSPLSAVPAECCGAIHEGLTGAVCELAKGHIGNHRGSFGRGHSAQWPVTPLSAQPTAQEPETKPASRATCESHGHIFGPKGCCLFCEAPKPEAAPSVPPATTALREALKEVEWVFIPNPDGTPGLYETCPRCWADRALRGGHRVGCELAAALTATEDTQ